MAETNGEYIVMFPLMAQGHIFPFLAFADKIAQIRDCAVFFVNTPLNIQKLRSSNPSSSSPIRFLEIPFDAVQNGLPPGTENTDSLPYDFVMKLVEACKSMKQSFKDLILDLIVRHEGRKPLCVISDMFFTWSGDLCREIGVFHALLLGGGAFGFACYHSLWVNLPHLKAGSDDFDVPDFPEASRIHVSQLSEYLLESDGTDSISVLLHRTLTQWKDADGILFNTVEEIDTKGLNFFRRKFNKPMWPIGPLILPRASETGSESKIYMEWLDKRPECSVLYVSFGSQNTISASQMMNLAVALEKSGRDFIWVVRPPVGFDINSAFKPDEWLPEGFEERIRSSNKGLLVHKWASQVEILKHISVAAFLSHCGWNSVLEALSHGVPILAWPLAAEQFYNSKVLEEEIGVCVEVGRGRKCEVVIEKLVEKIEMVMDVETEKGKEMRRKVREVKKMMENGVRDDEMFKGSSVRAMDEFLNAALAMKEKK